MSATVRKPGSRWPARIPIWTLVSGGLLLLVAANVHLVYVAVTSQPDCVAHAKVAGGDGGYRAARPAC